MAAVIIYATKHGATARAAQKLKEKIGGDVSCVNVKDAKKLNLSEYDTVVIGTSVYIGRPLKPIKDFMEANLEALKSKKLALFLCCMPPDQNALQAEIAGTFPDSLRQKALYTGSIGSAIDFKTLGFLEKAMYTKVTGIKEGYDKLDETAMDALADAVKQHA